MDDEEIIREVATEILAFAGYQVESCADGKEAVKRYRSAHGSTTPFDAVVMDLTIPAGMGGREAAELILEIDPAAVLIVSSGYSHDPVVADFRHYGFMGAVVKPFSAGALVAELRRLIRLKI
jgi:CheY-like chemotaxis protein